jgi:hypothetical protein
MRDNIVIIGVQVIFSPAISRSRGILTPGLLAWNDISVDLPCKEDRSSH